MPVKPNIRWMRVVGRSGLPVRARLVAYACGALYMDRDTLGNVRPGIPRLSADTGLSEATVKRALLDLQYAGYLRLATRGRTGRASLYVGTWRRRQEHEEPEATTALTFDCPHCGRQGLALADRAPGRPVCRDCAGT